MSTKTSAPNSTVELIRKLQESVAGSAPENQTAELMNQAIHELQRLSGSVSAEWQPISTAPTDGTCVLVYPPTWNNRSCSMAHYNPNEYAKKPRPYWERVDDLGKVHYSRGNPPTHWMPLPDEPKE